MKYVWLTFVSAALGVVAGIALVNLAPWTVGGVGADHTFPDVADGVYYHDDVEWLLDNGITQGCSATEYCPNDYVTRGQMATFLHRMAKGGSPRAFAYINKDGTKRSGTDNVTDVVWTGQRYDITLSGEDYYGPNYSTVVTPVGAAGTTCHRVHPSVGSGQGKLIVDFWDETDSRYVECHFQFVTFKP